MNEELTENQKRAMELIGDNDLNIYLCNDGFFIIEEWSDLNKMVALYNEVPLGYIYYGKVDIDMVLNPDKEFFRIDDILGQDSWGFSDEYMTCGSCGNSIRTSPDSWGWKPDYWIDSGEIICGECIRDSVEFTDSYIEYLINNTRRANTILGDKIIENRGFKKCNCGEDEFEFWNGLYEGADDDPKKILKSVIEKNPGREFIFDVLSVGQFDVNFTLWNREKIVKGEDE